MREFRIRIAFDYVDPGSWLTERILARWATERKVTPRVSWTPLELRRPPSPPIDPGDAGWRALCGAMEEAAKEEGVGFRPPTYVPWTRKAHELALHAEEKGCFDGVHQTLFEAHFLRSRDIGRVDELVRFGLEHGLDPAEVRTVLGVDRFLPRIEELRADLLREGIRGVPTLQAGERRLEGIRSTGELRSFLDEALSTI